MKHQAPLQILFSYAFRPFFLLVAGYAVLAIAGWGLYQAGVPAWPDSLPAQVRHGHEMLFGYAGGAIAGFLLTAVATWTGRPALSGQPLMALCGFWMAARIGAFLPGSAGFAIWGASSLLFWGAVSGLTAREVIAARNARNYKVLPLLLAFLGTEAVFFLAADHFERLEMCLRTGLFLVVGMISLVGGRIIPAFTQNWLKLNRPETPVQLPAFGPFDLATVVAAAAFGLGFIVAPASAPTGVLGLLAAVVQGMRLARWRGWLTGREPLLWVLHLGYGWLPVGFGLLGLYGLGAPALLFDAGVHALTYGAMGTLILGVAARVALGHTGRPLQAFPAMRIAFWLITLGTVFRLFASLGSGFTALSVVLWMGSYLVFLGQYAPILLGPRVRA